MRKTLETSVLFATKTDVNAQNKAKRETDVHYNRAAKHGKKQNRKNLQGVGVGVKTPQKTQNLLRVFKLLPKLLPLRISGVGSWCVFARTQNNSI